MKKIVIIATVMVMLMAGLSHAEFLRTVYGTPPNTNPEANNTLLSAVTAIGDGTAVDLGMTVQQHSCSVVLAGTVPTNVVVKLKGSLDNTTWLDLATHTVTPTEYITNGTFTGAATGWTLGAGWAYGTNNVAKTAGEGTLSQAVASLAATPASGEIYLVNFTISGWSKGSPALTFMGGTGSGTTVTADGTYNRIITTSSASGAFTFTPSASDDAYTMDDVKMVRNESGFHVVNKPVRYIKGSYTSKSGGGTDTAVTLYCTSGGN